MFLVISEANLQECSEVARSSILLDTTVTEVMHLADQVEVVAVADLEEVEDLVATEVMAGTVHPEDREDTPMVLEMAATETQTLEATLDGNGGNRRTPRQGMYTPTNTLQPGFTGRSPMTPYSTTSSAAITSLKRQIKLHKSEFETLKSESNWFHFRWVMESAARAQGIANVLDPNYVPSTAEEEELFRIQQNFLYSVLVQKVLIAKGIEIVESYHETADAQQAWKELCEYFPSSTHAALASYIITSQMALHHQTRNVTNGENLLPNSSSCSTSVSRSTTVSKVTQWHVSTSISKRRCWSQQYHTSRH